MADPEAPFFYIDARLTLEDADHHGDLVMRNALAQLNLHNPNDSFIVEEEDGMITHKTYEDALFLKLTDPHGISYFSQDPDALRTLIFYFRGIPDDFPGDPPADFFVNPVHFVVNHAANHAANHVANNSIGGYRRTRRTWRHKRTKRTRCSKRSKRARRTLRKK